MLSKSRSALTLEQRTEVRKSEKDPLSARKIVEQFVLFFFSLGYCNYQKKSHGYNS